MPRAKNNSTTVRVQSPVPWYKGSATGRMLWFCGSCKLEVAANHAYCPWCGRKFQGEKTTDAQKPV